MPARSARTICAAPFGIIWLAGLGTFPEHKIKRVIFAGDDVDALACAQLIKRLTRQLAVAWELANGKIHITVARTILCLIGQTFVLQKLDQTQHLRYKVCRTRLMSRTLNAQTVRILMQGLDHAISQRSYSFTIFNRTLNNFVVDISHVAYISNIQAGHLQPALHNVECHHGTRMTQVTKIVNRHSANIHAHMTGNDGRKIFYCT